MTNTTLSTPLGSARHGPRAANRWWTVNNIGILVLFVAFLAGKFSLARISDRFDKYGQLGDVAYWFVLPLLILAFISLSLSKFRRSRLPRSIGAFLLCAVLLNFYMALSSTWASAPDIDAVGQLLLVVVMLVIAYVFMRFGTEKQLHLILVVTFGAGLVYSFGGLAGGLDVGRLSAFGGGPNVFVRVVGGGLIAAIYLVLAQRKRFVLFTLPVLFVAALGSGSRGGIIALAVSALFLALFIMPRYLRWRTILWGGIALVFLAWITYNLIVDSGLMSTIETRYVAMTETRYLSGRDVRMSAAWYLFLDYPWVGVGLSGFRIVTGFPDYPHNLLLHVASEGGVLGLTPLLACLILLVYRWFQPRSVEHDFVLAILLMYFVASQISGQIYDARLIWFYGLAYMLPKRQNIPAFGGARSSPLRIAYSRFPFKAKIIT